MIYGKYKQYYSTLITRNIKVSSTLTGVLGQALNPLSPNSVQNQFSPNDIHTLSTDEL